MGAVTAAAQASTGSVLTATEYNKLPRGVVYYATVTADQTGFGTSATDITGLSATWTAISGHAYRTTLYVQTIQRTAASTISLILSDGAGTGQAGTQNYAGAVNAWVLMTLTHIETGLSGSVTRKARLFTNANTVDMIATGTSKQASIVVEDLGLA